MRVYLNLRVPVGGGVHLATDVFLPEGSGAFPAVLVRTPYHRTFYQGPARRFVERGYAFVAQDVRGKFDSEGEFRPLFDLVADGRATLDWLADQRWCNGNIALWGRSYEGMVQIPAATGGHEALCAVLPSVASGSPFRDWIRYDGCFALANIITWTIKSASLRTEPAEDHIVWSELYGLGTCDAIEERCGIASPFLREWAARDHYDAYWAEIDQEPMLPGIDVPGYHAGAWFDHHCRGQFQNYRRISDGGATSAARSGQRLLIGPWGHENFDPGLDRRRYGDWDFGPTADLPVLEEELRFIDLHLRDLDDGISEEPPVKLFLMGPDRWISLADWPPPGRDVQVWHLTPDRDLGVDGGLSLEKPQGSSAATYRYDPRDPAPTWGGPVYWMLDRLGPIDQRPILDRQDVLYYRSLPLARPLTVIGEVGLDLWMTTDGEDTDVVAKLCVEDPSGTVTCLTYGSFRLRYRGSWQDPQPIDPGEPVDISLEMSPTAFVFPKGSRIGLVVTSSDFPRIDPNPNRLAAPLSGVEPRVARNEILCGPGAPSRLTLSCVEL